MMILADTADYTAANAGQGLILLVMLGGFLVAAIYTVICVLVPVFIYRLMRRQTENFHILRQILIELRKQSLQFSPVTPPKITNS
jgi:hypothetical protein